MMRPPLHIARDLAFAKARARSWRERMASSTRDDLREQRQEMVDQWEAEANKLKRDLTASTRQHHYARTWGGLEG